MTPLTKHQTERLRDAMQQRRERLLGEIREVLTQTAEHPYADLAGVPDIGDEAVADLLIDVDNAMVHRDIQEVRDIEAAVGRMDDGSYGVCIDCRQEIDHERLSAFPTAKRCIRCQVQHERTYAGERTPKL